MSDSCVRLVLSRPEAEWLLEEAEEEGLNISEEDWIGLRDQLRTALQEAA